MRIDLPIIDLVSLVSYILTFVIRGIAEQTTANQKVEPSMGDYEAANNRSNSRGILVSGSHRTVAVN